MASEAVIYNKLSDEDLVARSKSGDSRAVDFLMERYKNLVRKKARALFLIGGDHDDLIQEGMIGLYKAICDYSAHKQVTFFHFAEICITRQLYNAVKASRRKKNTPLNSYISLYTPLNDDSAESELSATLADTLPPKESLNPESIILDKESTQLFEEEIEKRLSTFERLVLELFLEGEDYREIACTLNKSPKSIDNALQRIRTKLKKKNI